MRIFRAAVIVALLLALPTLAMRGDVSGLLNELIGGELLAAWNADDGSAEMQLPTIEVLRPEQVAVMPELISPEVAAQSPPRENYAEASNELDMATQIPEDDSAGRRLRPAIYRPLGSDDSMLIRRVRRGTDL